MKSLLEKAKEVKVLRGCSKYYSNEEFEIAVAWCNGEIRTKQVIEVLGFKNTSRGSIYNFLAMAIKKGVEKGKIKLILKKGN